ncbi:hypothetical protein LXL04_004292 [Taraxacum kok-saghyz]
MESLAVRHLICNHTTYGMVMPVRNPPISTSFAKFGAQNRNNSFVLHSKKSNFQGEISELYTTIRILARTDSCSSSYPYNSTTSDFQGYAKPVRLLPAHEVKPTTDSSLESLVTSFKEDELQTLYTLTIQTSNYYGSGLTNSNAGILLCLVDENGDSILQRISATSNTHSKDNDPSDLLHFTRGAINHFTFQGPAIRKLEALWIGLESGQWRPAGVRIICWSQSNQNNNNPYGIFQYDFITDDILLGDENDISMVELRPNLVTNLSGNNLTLNQTFTQPSFQSNEESMKEYTDLKFSLLLYDALLIITGSTVSSFFGGENGGLAFLTGGIGGFLYLLLLQRSVDELASPVLTRTGGLDEMFGRFKGQVAVLVLALGVAVVVVKLGSGDGSVVLTPKDVVVGMIGFLSSKVAVVLAAFKPLPAVGQYHNCYTPIPPIRYTYSGYHFVSQKNIVGDDKNKMKAPKGNKGNQ